MIKNQTWLTGGYVSTWTGKKSQKPSTLPHQHHLWLTWRAKELGGGPLNAPPFPWHRSTSPQLQVPKNEKTHLSDKVTLPPGEKTSLLVVPSLHWWKVPEMMVSEISAQ